MFFLESGRRHRNKSWTRLIIRRGLQTQPRDRHNFFTMNCSSERKNNNECMRIPSETQISFPFDRRETWSGQGIGGEHLLLALKKTQPSSQEKSHHLPRVCFIFNVSGLNTNYRGWRKANYTSFVCFIIQTGYTIVCSLMVYLRAWTLPWPRVNLPWSWANLTSTSRTKQRITNF